MPTETIPNALTSGRIADLLGVPLWRVRYIIQTRPHIQPAARAGNAWLFNKDTIAMIRHELNAMDARRCGRGGANVE